GPISKAHTVSPEVLRAITRLANSRIDDFLHDMGIDVALRTEAAATPFGSIRLLHRDEFARFGIDARDFGETGWHYVEKPKLTAVKTFFVRTEKEQLVHRSAMLELSCYSPKTMTIWLAREVGPSEPTFATPPLTAKGRGWNFDFVMAAPIVGASGTRIDIGTTSLPGTLVDLLTSAGDADTFEIVPKFMDQSMRCPHSVTLTMSGFSAAYAVLRKTCDEQPAPVTPSPGVGASPT